MTIYSFPRGIVGSDISGVTRTWAEGCALDGKFLMIVQNEPGNARNKFLGVTVITL
jgi:hypothetical protein